MCQPELVSARLGVVRVVMALSVLSLITLVGGSSTASALPPAHHAVPVLGYRHLMPPPATGWGTAHPRRFYNGGDGASQVIDLRWRSWGAARSEANGKRYWFRPHGGYYRHPVRAEVRASDLGKCHGEWAYRKLFIRQATKPGAPIMTRWRPWWPPHGGIC
jgi:hypothetical protein